MSDNYNIDDFLTFEEATSDVPELQTPEDILNDPDLPDLTNVDQDLIKIKAAAPPKPSLDHEIEMWDKIESFEKRAWSKKNQGLKTGWASIDKAFDGGLVPGFIVIGGDSNLGKSGFITQLAQQVAHNNSNAYVMDFSLDDPLTDKIPRIVGSINRVMLNAVKQPQNYKHIPLMLQRREVGLNKLRAMCNTYNVYDANFSTYVEDIEDEIKRIMVMLDAACLDKQIIVCIDNMHDLNLKNQPGLTDKLKYDTIAQWCSDTAIKYNLIMICSAELKKLNGIRRPSLDDLRETVKIKYEAKAVLLVYNEVHYKGESAGVFFLRANEPLKQPVFEVHFAKNKFHTFKGRLFFEFYPEMARFEEADPQAAKTYASVVFGS